jgi:CRISPR-associated protein Csd1
MILQALSEYYQRKAQEESNELAPLGFEKKEIPFIIVLDGEGRFVDLEDTRTGEGKKKAGRIFLVPQGEKRSGKNSWQVAFLLWDHIGYVLGYSAKDKERAQKQQQSFLAKIESIFSDLAIDVDIGAVKEFLRKGDFSRIYNHPLWQEIIKDFISKNLTPNVSFRLLNDDQLVCQQEAVRRKIAEQAAADRQQLQRCLLSGERDAIARLHPPIKGVQDRNGKTSDTNIVSFNLAPFNSYGKTQGFNASIGVRTAFAYTTALNHLLRNGSRQRLQVGDASTIFWAAKDHPSEEQFAACFDFDSDNPDRGIEAIRALYAAPQSGAKPLDEDKLPSMCWVWLQTLPVSLSAFGIRALWENWPSIYASISMIFVLSMHPMSRNFYHCFVCW